MNPLTQRLQRQDRVRLDNYRRFLAFYNGDQWPTTIRRSKLRRVTVNYTRAIVKKATGYVMKGFAVNIEPHADTDEARAAAAAAEDAWRAIADANALARVDIATETDCAVLGDAGYKVTWDPAAGRVVITAVDMAGIHVEPDPFATTSIRRLWHRYQLSPADLALYWTVEAPAAATQVQVTEEWTADYIAVYVGDAPAPVRVDANPYGLIPYVIYPNEQVPKQWWGESDIAPLYDVAQELNSEYSRLSNIMELSGNPITAVSGVDDAGGLESYPGAIWELPEGARAEIIDALKSGAGAAHLAYLDDVRRVLHDLSETPRTAFGETGGRELSGVALEVELEPLLQKATRKRAIRTEAHTARVRMAFTLSDKLGGTALLAAGRIAIHWEHLTPRDATREISNEDVAVRAAISSRRAAIQRLGSTDPDAELAQIEAERKTLTATAPPPVDKSSEPA